MRKSVWHCVVGRESPIGFDAAVEEMESNGWKKIGIAHSLGQPMCKVETKAHRQKKKISNHSENVVIEEVVIYNRVLSAKEIKRLRGVNKGRKSKKLYAFYPIKQESKQNEQ